MLQKVAYFDELVKKLKSSEGLSTNTRDAEHVLEQTLLELHLPQRMGWMLRVMQAGAILGVHDFWIERVCANLSISMLPGRLANGAQQAAVLHIKFAARSGEKDHGFVLRCERVHLHRLEQRLFLPQDLEVPSLTLALGVEMDMSFAFGSNEEWVCASMRFEILKLKSDFGGGPAVPDLILRWLLEKACATHPYFIRCCFSEAHVSSLA